MSKKEHKERVEKLRKDIRNGKLPHKKRENIPDEVIQISPIAIRNQLAEEYNRLIREGDPETKELREQIHDQIQKLEKTDA